MTLARSPKTFTMHPELIAPCGMNCRLCMAYIRDKKSCPGCRADDTGKAKSCAQCKIKNCQQLAQGNYQFCYQCDDYPCQLIRHIDKRYRTKYGMSMIENLQSIKQDGIDYFIEREKEKWLCPECGDYLCVHYAQCRTCGHTWR